MRISKRLILQRIKRSKYLFAIFFLIALNISLLSSIAIISAPDINKYVHSHFFNTKQIQKAYPEIESIKKMNNIRQESVVYLKLIKRVGPAEAQEALYHSGLPFDGQTHLLNHTLGEYLYDTFGDAGLTYCRDYFLSSCYHGFILKLVAQKGLNELSAVSELCKKAAPGVFAQCAHGMGHGFVSYYGYKDLTLSLDACSNLANKISGFPLFNCLDGVFMENIWGVHEGTPSPDRWLKDSDPIYPCDDPRISERYINACWAEQPSRMYQLFKGNLEKVSHECLVLANKTYRTTCFDGLARQIHPLTMGDPKKAKQMCSTMPEGWADNCLMVISRSAFSVGDRSTLPMDLCNEVSNSTNRNNCFHVLSNTIKYLVPEKSSREPICKSIPISEQAQYCLN